MAKSWQQPVTVDAWDFDGFNSRSIQRKTNTHTHTTHKLMILVLLLGEVFYFIKKYQLDE